jgi:hypothetical protein
VSNDDDELAALVRQIDALEDAADGPLTLEAAVRAAGRDLDAEIDAALLLVDYRTRADGSPVTLCRLNRQHPLVRRLTTWA